MNINQIPMRNEGRPTFSIAEANAILSALKSQNQGRRFEAGANGASTADAIPEIYRINVQFNEQLPAWSIFPVKYNGRGFFPVVPLVHADEDLDPSELAKDSGIIYVTNGGVPTNENDVLYCWIIGNERPHRIRYVTNSSGSPALGKKVKPSKTTNAVELHRNGQFVCVSPADTNEDTIWIVRKDTLYTPTPYVRTCNDPGTGLYPSSSSNKFVVERGYLDFDDTTTGYESPTFVAYAPPEYYIAYSERGYLPVGTICRMTLDHGLWYIVPQGGEAGTPVVMFVIDDILRGDGLMCNAVEATVLNISCNNTTVNVGDSIEVWDSLGCIFNCPMELLIGVRGYATRMTTPPVGSALADEQFPSGPQPETPCRWEVTTLCCVE